MSGSRPQAPLIDAEEDLVATPPVAAARRRLRAVHPALVLTGIVLAALNMRAALAGVSPLLGEIGTVRPRPCPRTRPRRHHD
ncbi:hypothetical protein [Streptomyces sirii]|uniref:hypothetical protein n=1 Tax=Streptomyces sirii TaxID=3127701 RepID=UPI003D36EB0A